jgi:hypothetical protein
MIQVSEIIKETTSNMLDENGEHRKAIPTFKKQFAKKTKDLWEIFDNSTKFTNRELIVKIEETMLLLAHLKHDVSEYSKDNAESIDDWV